MIFIWVIVFITVLLVFISQWVIWYVFIFRLVKYCIDSFCITILLLDLCTIVVMSSLIGFFLIVIHWVFIICLTFICMISIFIYCVRFILFVSLFLSLILLFSSLSSCLSLTVIILSSKFTFSFLFFIHFVYVVTDGWVIFVCLVIFIVTNFDLLVIVVIFILY